MSQQTILKAENISKQYRLGNVGTGTLSHDLNRWWHQIRGKENPYAKVGAVNDRSATATQDYVWAIKNINFEVKQGEVLGIIGKNGAGKSTLLKILSRVTSPTTGSIKTKGRIASLLEVGTGFHPELTGKENIYLNGAILGMNKAEINSKIDEIIEFSGCQMYIDTPVKRYSSGMRVRLAFAVAAFLEPDILVIDEVLAVGDAEFQKKAIGKMQDISKGDGRTVIFVSHNMAAIRNLCNRCIVLKDGYNVFEGNQEEAVNFYLNSTIENKINKEFFYKNSEREGKGDFYIEKALVNSFEGNKLVSVGEQLNIIFYIKNNENSFLKDLILDIRIDDNFENKIVWLSTSLKEENINKDISKITFQFPKCPLNNGLYFVTSQLRVNNEIQDWVKNAFSFHVEQGKFYKRAGEVPTSQSKVLLDFNLIFS
ncbi:ABC transporter ATP-binding protein [Croceibacter atlanticus]|uniref:ABC transporter ATP-binding protein n=1 Tax=Croceibacter atlanticus TaxID=313588 RepID=UPI0024BA1098|nr:ABC transporter ATP-binding protein [Croceibacter atlanticus]WSP33511.1 ABC transporter ATP-binding protein [Croceibacter atlanticus]